MMSTIRRSLFLLGCMLAVSCASDRPFFRIGIQATDTVTLAPGESTPLEITLSREADFPGEVRLNLANAPAGVTLTPEVILPEGETSITASPTLAVAAETTAQGMQRTQLLAEDAANDVAAGATLFLVILPLPTTQPDFSVAVAPRQVNLIVGQSTQVPVTITRAEGFTGPVTVTLTSPTTRVRADAATIAAGQSNTNLFVFTERSATPLPIPTTVVATSEDGRQATTGFTVNLRP
ncbi:hypothetical protein [Pyxidicoccus xibeiensis]|uniref:hypothetical protein n=1 Tax=Pyxidicoccus xibeiensis TaxID=2906759 RepID=UPI0020A7EF07|nr:hypothetical protein [Pyxidicoccus xibeiensis]MCP3138949.1 hypothetical protein [Pyxidicoccus xibeiensis]